MSAPDTVAPRCQICGNRSVGEHPKGSSYHLCERHLKEFTWKDALRDELKSVVGTWAKGHKLTQHETAEIYAELDPHLETLADADTPVPRPERVDHFIEVEFRDVALALPMFHLLREQAALSGFEDVWVKHVDLTVEILGDDKRLDELRGRLENLWIGAHVTTKERLPRRQ